MSNRWLQHFKKVLNSRSIYDKSVLDAFPTSPPLLHLDDPPTITELEDAMSRLKIRKADGLPGILPELVLYGGPVSLRRLLVLMQAVWREGCVLKDALIVPVPKKGDLQFCDNWQGISLLDVVGKIFAWIIQDQ